MPAGRTGFAVAEMTSGIERTDIISLFECAYPAASCLVTVSTIGRRPSSVTIRQDGERYEPVARRSHGYIHTSLPSLSTCSPHLR
ncbi:hypothetical protein MGYG_02801 [Nannizzia gypsea CBS 118893]|uniref:Uncharacterized protein n=1 Tax=Arthroderma gypseum (strain ATCC MYA-4604 / CBS 118893) TaxID=535722 RepID=E4UP35_ARTGP|nr:hypothetical protein MGYG_02801 [Nannizzia gypsea CBS 118893]EFQ99788.1 hypothetical protein MGYG_02801 [Nannizzia gypsea CBS 118893]